MTTPPKRPRTNPHSKSQPPATTGAEPRDDAPATPFPIVGIGMSAGGLEVATEFLNAMPPDSGMGFVLVQHLDPTHPSILAEILQRSTAMPVVEAADGMAVLPNRVHVIPPNRDMLITHGVLGLSLPSEPRGRHLPIDSFFRALAADRAEAAVGIILSGTGTDGTLGIRAIHGAGGLGLVQEPSTARFDGMPSSALRSGFATQALAVEAMPALLQALLMMAWVSWRGLLTEVWKTNFSFVPPLARMPSLPRSQAAASRF